MGEQPLHYSSHHAIVCISMAKADVFSPHENTLLSMLSKLQPRCSFFPVVKKTYYHCPREQGHIQVRPQATGCKLLLIKKPRIQPAHPSRCIFTEAGFRFALEIRLAQKYSKLKSDYQDVAASMYQLFNTDNSSTVGDKGKHLEIICDPITFLSFY